MSRPRTPPARPVIVVVVLVAAVLAGLLLQAPEPPGVTATPKPRKAVAPQVYDPAPDSTSPPGQVADRGSARRPSRSAPTRQPVTSGLDVTMDSLSPAALDPNSPVQITGTITDVDDADWGNLKVYLVLDAVPSVTPDDLDTVLESEPDAVTGERIAEIGFFDELGDLEAGGTVSYSLDVPFRLLELDGATGGVYTVGVHVLADRADGERITAGRVRTLMPLVPDSIESPPVDLTVLLPLRTPLLREPDGTYEDLDAILELIEPGGRMRNVLDLAATAGTGDAALVVDPALIDLLLATTADDFASPLSRLAPSEDEAAPGPDAEASDPDDGPDLQTPVDGVVSPAQRRYAADFLVDLRDLASTTDLLVEPYGAADLATVQEQDRRSLLRAIARAEAIALDRADLQAEQVFLPQGDLAPDRLARLARRRTLVLGSEQVRGWDVSEGAGTWLRPPDDTANDQGDNDAADRGGGSDRAEAPVVVAEDSLRQGAPEPGRTDTAIQIRQRLLSETAVLSLGAATGDDGTVAPGLVHLAADDWDPGLARTGGDLFDALDTPWIDTMPVAAQLPGDDAARAAPEDDPGAGVDQEVVVAARGILSRATLVQSLVGEELRVLRWYDRSAALAVSTYQRDDPDPAQERADAVSTQLDEQLGRVAVEGPEFVTLSSDSGSFPITVTNNLSRPITVGLSLSDSTETLRFEDVPLQTVAAGGSAQLSLDVGAPDLGVTAVTATLVTPNGRPFGTPAVFNLRSSVVGAVIWVAFGAGGLFFVLLVARRLGRRIASSRRSQVAS